VSLLHNNIRKSECVTNRLLYQLSVFSSRAGKCTVVLRGLRQRFVLVIGLPGQQHPERVDAKCRSERDV
jgi:hypothetical protein